MQAQNLILEKNHPMESWSPELKISKNTSDGYFRKPFLINRTVGVNTEISQQLSAKTVPENSAYLGIAGQNSLDNLCLIGNNKKRYSNAFLFDTNKRQISAMNMMLGIIKDCETPDEFISQFSAKYPHYLNQPKTPNDPDFFTYNALPQEEKKRYFDVFGAAHPKYQPQTEADVKEYLEEKAQNKSSWLHEDNYQYIHDMVIHGSLKTVNLDLCDMEKINDFKAVLDEKNLQIGDFYLSSIKGFMNPNLQTSYYTKAGESFKKTAAFYDGIIKLTNDNSNFIISEVEHDKPFLQNYTLTIASKQEIEDELSQMQIDGEPTADKKIHDYIFSAGGKQWRMMSFDSADSGRYYRLFSANPTNDSKILEAQITRINATLSKMSTELSQQNLPPVKFLEVNNGYDANLFNEEHKKMLEGSPSIASCMPFKIENKQGDSPAKTLALIEKQVSTALKIEEKQKISKMLQNQR